MSQVFKVESIEPGVEVNGYKWWDLGYCTVGAGNGQQCIMYPARINGVLWHYGRGVKIFENGSWRWERTPEESQKKYAKLSN